MTSVMTWSRSRSSFWVATTQSATMVKENAGNTPSDRTRRTRIALILSLFCFLSLYTFDESSNEESLSPSENRRQLISDNVWEADLQARQLRLKGSNLNKKQRLQIERKRMLEEDLAAGEPSANGNKWNAKGRGPPTDRYVSFGNWCLMMLSYSFSCMLILTDLIFSYFILVITDRQAPIWGLRRSTNPGLPRKN